jgi:ASC-1-like (ASCH) protein
MCAYYDDEQKIKKGDIALFKDDKITIISAKHIKENRTMDITYKLNDEENLLNIPYKTAGFGLSLISREIKQG